MLSQSGRGRRIFEGGNPAQMGLSAEIFSAKGAPSPTFTILGSGTKFFVGEILQNLCTYTYLYRNCMTARCMPDDAFKKYKSTAQDESVLKLCFVKISEAHGSNGAYMRYC